MATLVLSTVGTVLGGPVGSAIGALIGQSIDQELLAPARRGPRLGDLAVQTSSYGTQVPRIYGVMRVAGSVIWATDLVERENTDGAKGAPDVSYTYTVSLAVALSSRPIKSVKRIWADGKLLRGAGGDFKVGTVFRLHDGSEDQEVDTLIASSEGLGNTPAHRGLAYAVFEDLELGEFGNRIPFLTFEIEADEAPPTAGLVLSDSSAGVIMCDSEQTVRGFAAYGGSIKVAVQPLVDAFAIELFDDGAVLRGATAASAIPIGGEEFGCGVGEPVGRLHRQQLSSRSTPAVLRLGYYDSARDYQAGEARAVASEQQGSEMQRDLPAVLAAADAKSLAQQVLAREWAKRDKLTLRLPPRRMALEPGSKIELPLGPSLWTIDKTTLESFVTIAELRPCVSSGIAVAADGGKIVPNSDEVAGPTTLALLDVPNPLGVASDDPTLLLVASCPGAGWKRRAVEISFGGQSIAVDTARTKSILGRAETLLGSGGSELIDERNTVEVQLIDADQWLINCDDEALASGKNSAVIGNELVQFGRATPLGAGRFRLAHLLRGRAGTEWACSEHVPGEIFCLLQGAGIQPVSLPGWSVGSVVSATAGEASTSIPFAGQCLRPPSPVGLDAALQPNGDLVLGWTRRSRVGFAWIDEIDAPIGEAREQYRVTIVGGSGYVEILAEEPQLTLGAGELSSVGGGPINIQVRQIGDVAASLPAQLSINLSQEAA